MIMLAMSFALKTAPEVKKIQLFLDVTFSDEI